MNEKEVFQIFMDCWKPAKKLQFSDCLAAVLEKLDIPELPSENHHSLRNCFDRYLSWKAKLGKQGNSAVFSAASAQVIITIDGASSTTATPQVRKKRKSENLQKSQLDRRTDKIFEEVTKFAKEEGYEDYKILGLLLKRCKNKEAKEIGEKHWSDSLEQKSEIPVENSLVLYTYCNLGRKTYTNERKILPSIGFKILPSWSKLRKTQQEVSPTIMNVPTPHVGVYFRLLKEVEITTVRIFQDIDDKKLKTGNYRMKIKFGFDGSGSHAIYHQVNNGETNNMILSVFCPLKIEDESGNSTWIQESPNAPLTQRPVCLQMDKEPNETLTSLELFNDDISKLKDVGFDITKNSVNYHVNVDINYMMDMKAAHLYLGTGGAYCDLCSLSKEDCLSLEKIEAGFFIDRTVDSIQHF